MSEQSQKRRRGVVLTSEGLRRLRLAIEKTEYWENDGLRLTLEDLSERIGIDSKTIAKVLEGQKGIDKRTLERCFDRFGLELNESDYAKSSSVRTQVQNRIDWGEAVDISNFSGRVEELEILPVWLQDSNCRVVTILGMGGIGKTSLSVKLALQLQEKFELIIWRSLRNAPPLTEFLADLLQFFAPDTQANLSTNITIQIRQLLGQLRSHRCLIIFDNWETLLRSSTGTKSDIAGFHRQGYENYGDFLKQLAETSHQSAIVLTSREKPAEIAALEGESLPVRTFLLQGLPEKEARDIFRAKGLLGSETEFDRLSQLYQGNPLALKIIATTIQDIFAGKIGEFFAEKTTIFNGIRVLIEQQFQRLSELEKELMYWLAINREPVSLAELRSDFVFPISSQKLLEALESLHRRCLIQTNLENPDSSHPTTQFTLQPVVMEYVTASLIEQLVAELTTPHTPSQTSFLHNYALSKAQAKNYIRTSQIELILHPIVDELLAIYHHPQGVIQQLTQILASLRASIPHQPSYKAGNLLNLLCHLNADLTGYDFSNLAVWQAYLQETHLPQVNFSNSDLSKSVFANTFSIMMGVAFSPDGQVLATGNWDEQVYLWDVRSGNQLLACSGHQDKIWSVAFHPKGHLVASGSDDRTIKLWDTRGGKCLHTLTGHTGCVRSLVFSPKGKFLYSGSSDRSIRQWNVSTGQCLRVLNKHTAAVWSIALSSDGHLLASGSDDLTIELWDASTGACLKTLEGHTDWIRAVALNLDATLLASCSVDGTIRLWDVKTGKCTRILEGHANIVFSVVFIPGQNLLASSSLDQTIRLWNLETGKCEKTMLGHANSIYSLATNSQGTLLASASNDQTARLWSLPRGACIRTIRGRINWIASVAFSPDGNKVVSGSEDRAVRVWSVGTGECITLHGHRDVVYCVAFSPNGCAIATGSIDQSIKLWDVNSGQVVKTLRGHTAQISAVQFSPKGSLLASASHDGTVRLWDIETGKLLQSFSGHFVNSVAFTPDGTKLAIAAFDPVVRLWDLETEKYCQAFTGHSDWAWQVAVSPNGSILASGSMDGTIRLWDINTGNCINLLKEHSGWIFSLAFSPNSCILASSCSDCTIKLWDVGTGTCIRTLADHTSWVMSVAFNPQGDILVSGSGYETIKLWDVATGNCLQTWKIERFYEGMKITGAMGLSEAQKASLKALGAVDCTNSV